jgi:hypothetical protein
MACLHSSPLSCAASPTAAAADLITLLNVNNREDANKLTLLTHLHATSTVSSLSSLPASRIMPRQQGVVIQGASLFPLLFTPVHTVGGSSFVQQGRGIKGVGGVKVSFSTKTSSRGGSMSPASFLPKTTGSAQRCIFIDESKLKSLCFGRIGTS